MQTTRLKLHWMSKIADILLRNMNDLFTMHSCTAFMFNVTSNTARFWSLNYASWLSSLQWPYHQYVFDTKIEKYKCSEVTRKNEMNKCKRQSALLRPSRHFSFNDFKFEYSRPLVLPKNAARSQQKKGIVRWGSARSEPNKRQELSTSELFSQLPTALCLGGWDISISFCNRFS